LIEPPPAQIPHGSATFTTGRDAQIERSPIYDECNPPPVDAVDDDIPF
jgi:hypothetical protein